ncbi:MAG: helix-turn-helix transcriptional regulator [Ktedonobacteraceae bacterium]|nr:helix-turn-helix transcriptional regulator [Ktedonobacteraceae bacterium]
MTRLRVKEIAEVKGFNQSSLSRASNVSFNTVKRIFRDPYHNVTRDILERLAKALGVGMAELYEEEPNDREK